MHDRPLSLQKFGDKTAARELAIKTNVAVVPGTDGPVSTFQEASMFINVSLLLDSQSTDRKSLVEWRWVPCDY
jgi:hypothetical protein